MNRVINSLTSIFERKKPMENPGEQIELNLSGHEGLTQSPDLSPTAENPMPAASGAATAVPEHIFNVTQLSIAGQGSDKPELHIGNSGSLIVMPLTNPVTPKQIADILATLN
jgi:hypothetical protein